MATCLSGSEARVANIELRVTLTTSTGAMNVRVGSGVVRNLGSSQRQTVSIDARAPNRGGLGNLIATVTTVMAEDPRTANNEATKRIVID